MTTTQRAGPLCGNAQSTGSISLIVQLIRGSHQYEAVRKSRRKPSYSSESENNVYDLGVLVLNLTRVLLDAYSRRHEAQKIYLRQSAAQRWIGWRDHTLQGQPPQVGHTEQLALCDAQLRVVSSLERSSSLAFRSLGLHVQAC